MSFVVFNPDSCIAIQSRDSQCWELCSMQKTIFLYFFSFSHVHLFVYIAIEDVSYFDSILFILTFLY